MRIYDFLYVNMILSFLIRFDPYYTTSCVFYVMLHITNKTYYIMFYMCNINRIIKELTMYLGFGLLVLYNFFIFFI